MRKAFLVAEPHCFKALSENISCGAKQHLIYCCSQPCGGATAPPCCQDIPLHLGMATHTKKAQLKILTEMKKVKTMIKEHGQTFNKI